MTRLDTGAEMRLQGPTNGPAIVCLNGGRRAAVEGSWNASIEWLVQGLVPRFPQFQFAEVRYRIKSWEHLTECIEDARAAVREIGAARTLMVGFSMGGAVSAAVAAEPSVEGVLGLAPWLPDRLSLEPLRGRRLRVLHGSLDRGLPGIPGVQPELSRRGFERALKLGAEGEYTLIPGGVHGLAVRSPWGALLPLPRAHRWAELAAAELERFAG